MNYLEETSISDYLNALAKKSATPGGGSASALVASTAISLLLMCMKFSTNNTCTCKKKLIESQIKKCEKIQNKIKLYIKKDMDAYQKYAKTEKENKDKELYNTCIVLFDMMCICNDALKLANNFERYCSRYMKSDFKSSKEMLKSAYMSQKIISSESIANLNNVYLFEACSTFKKIDDAFNNILKNE